MSQPNDHPKYAFAKEKRKASGVLATTHLDRHGERFTKEDLEQIAKEETLSDHPIWLNWNHQTTLPPIGVFTHHRVQARQDGEYELVTDIEMLGDEDYEELQNSSIQVVDDRAVAILRTLEPATPSYLEISYDTLNFAPVAVRPVVKSLNEIVPTREEPTVRKAEIPEAVFWVLIGGIVSGFITRLGEVLADKALETGRSLLKQLGERFAKLLELDPANRPDVIFSIHMPDTSTIIEGAVEDADKTTLSEAWESILELCALAAHILEQNRRDYFAEVKFLFNPLSKKWEINYITTRETKRVILGPRYNDPTHPLHQRWTREHKEMKQSTDLGMSIAGRLPG